MIKRYLTKPVDSLHRNKYQTLNTVRVLKDSLINNVSVFEQLDADKKIFAVLKSNAYGHGLKQVAKALNKASVEFIAVDGYFEANRILSVTKHKILVMGYVLPQNARLLDSRRCSFVVQDVEGLRALGKLKRHFNIHLELNTGMNRLGLLPAEVDMYLKELASHKNLNLEGIMSHLADADNPENDFTQMQTKRFDSAVKAILSQGFRPKYIHLAQSAGSTKCASRYANAIRIGIGLYGINPLDPKDPNYSKLQQLLPAMELESTIIKVLALKSRERISYNGIYTTSGDTRIGVLPLGYYEWVPRELSDKGLVNTDEHVLPIRGRVCMNHTMVDLTGTTLNVGDKVTVINSDKTMPNSIQNISKKYGLFSYSLLTRTSESIRRELV